MDDAPSGIGPVRAGALRPGRSRSCDVGSTGGGGDDDGGLGAGPADRAARTEAIPRVHGGNGDDSRARDRGQHGAVHGPQGRAPVGAAVPRGRPDRARRSHARERGGGPARHHAVVVPQVRARSRRARVVRRFGRVQRDDGVPGWRGRSHSPRGRVRHAGLLRDSRGRARHGSALRTGRGGARRGAPRDPLARPLDRALRSGRRGDRAHDHGERCLHRGGRCGAPRIRGTDGVGRAVDSGRGAFDDHGPPETPGRVGALAACHRSTAPRRFARAGPAGGRGGGPGAHRGLSRSGRRWSARRRGGPLPECPREPVGPFRARGGVGGRGAVPPHFVWERGHAPARPRLLWPCGRRWGPRATGSCESTCSRASSSLSSGER